MLLNSPRTVVVGGLGLTLAVLIGCQRGDSLAPAAPPPPVVKVVRPVVRPVQGYHEYTGYLEPAETFQARARVKGFLNEVRFRDGDEVKAGDLLYEIDPREYQAIVARAKADVEKAKADVANWDVQITLAAADVDRMKSLGASMSVSERDKVTAALAAAKAQKAAAVANSNAAAAAVQTAELELSYTRIVSPIDGRVSRTQVTKGNLVGQGETTLLTTVVSMDPLFVYFDVPEQDLFEYDSPGPSNGKPSRVVLIEIGVAKEEGYPTRGELDFQENRADTGTGTVRLRGRITNGIRQPSGRRPLYPGLFARIRTPAGPERTLPVIPEEALMTGQEGRYVYVVGTNDVIEKRMVTVGPSVWKATKADTTAWVLAAPAAEPGKSGGKSVRSVVSVEKGLEPTDRVVVIGLQKARPGAPVTPEELDLRGPAK